jgi:pimeloyl-ACP methyl ester carboxylesterase
MLDPITALGSIARMGTGSGSANNRSDLYLQRALDGGSGEERRLRDVEGAFASLPQRYLGADEGFSATYRIELEDLGMGWGVELDAESCRVLPRPTRKPDVIIGTDSATWMELRAGELSGLDAFRSRRLWARGHMDLAIAFEGFFRLPNGRPPLLRVRKVRAGKARISTLTAGNGVEHVVLIHGLGGTKSSFYETVSALAPRFTVHAIDLPGFGASSKSARASYDPAWFARSVVRFLDAQGIRRAHLVGNSLGGRIALEVGLSAPERVNSLSLLTPSLAWRKHRGLVPLVKLLRPELAAIPHTLTSQLVRRQFWGMFGRPERLHPSVADLAVEEFLAGYRDPAARVAFSAAARHIYLEEPDGPDGFWTRLAGLEPPALFVWGDEDPLVPLAFCAHVSETLPHARQVVLNDCGHVPQVEHPEDTNGLLAHFIASAPSPAHARAVAHLGRAARRIRDARPRVGMTPAASAKPLG